MDNRISLSTRGAKGWLSPLIYFSNNWISLSGVVIVTTSTIFWLFLLPTTLRGEAQNPYIGILSYLALPAAFFSGLLLIPLGILWRRRRALRRGEAPSSFPPLTMRNVQFRRLVVFIGVTTFVNLIIGSQLTYAAVTYMEQVSFCGQTCHTVMEPEFTAYQNSPHSRVECVSCHIGAGASWFVRSKLSGVGQVVAVALNNYPRPIPTPVHNLRPARETCETCHWPQKYAEDRLRVIPKFADDQTNTLTKTVLMLKLGGGNHGVGIHGTHLGPGVHIRYAHSDEGRQTIPWVQYSDSTGRKTTYVTPGAKPDAAGLPVREMDCMDCHNRPSHAYELPERAVDTAMYAGSISAALPFAKKESLGLLKQSYAGKADAAARIPAAFETYYQKSHPAIYGQRRAEVTRSAQAVLAIYNRNIFPDMKVTWGLYPNNLGHTDFPGCFRCHDEQHAAADGKTISQDCSRCHNMLAMDEPEPKILTDLGIEAR